MSKPPVTPFSVGQFLVNMAVNMRIWGFKQGNFYYVVVANHELPHYTVLRYQNFQAISAGELLIFNQEPIPMLRVEYVCKEDLPVVATEYHLVDNINPIWLRRQADPKFWLADASLTWKLVEPYLG